MPCCGSVGGCGARAVSRKTPIYFIIYPPPKVIGRKAEEVAEMAVQHYQLPYTGAQYLEMHQVVTISIRII